MSLFSDYRHDWYLWIMYKWACKEPHTHTHTHKNRFFTNTRGPENKTKFKIAILKVPQTYRVFQRLMKLLLQRMDVTQLVLTWVGWPNTENIASLCMQILILIRERTSSQVNPSAGKACPNGLPHTILRSMWPQRHCRGRNGFHARYIFHHSSVFFYLEMQT